MTQQEAILSTAEKKDEDAAKQLRDITDHVPVLIAYLDADRKFRFINKTGELWYAKPAEDIVGKASSDVRGSSNVTRSEDLFRALEKGMSRFENTALYPDGVVRTVDYLAVPDRAPDGTLRGYYRLGTDVTERKAIERQLLDAKASSEAANRSKSEFLARMSHEIRTPMNGVLGFTSLLLDTPLDDRQKEYATIAHDCAQTLLTLINDILDYSKIEAGKIQLEKLDFDPAAITRSVVELLRGEAEKKHLSVSIAIDGRLPKILKGDPNRLRQVLVNLLSNAIKFTERGEVDVSLSSARLNGHTVLRFNVRDTGVGISDAAQKHLFELFSQADSSIARRFGGTGLGLAISKSLVELMGGEIVLSSKEGEGSTFSFTVPLAAPAEGVACLDTAQHEVEPHRAPRRTARPSLPVLVVDDIEVNRRLVSLVLGAYGYAVECAASGADALARIAKGGIGLVLLDLHMPGMDGYEATTRIRALGEGIGTVPVIAMTADAMAGMVEKCLRSGMDDYIAKPVSKEDLLSAVERALAKNSDRRTLESPRSSADAEAQKHAEFDEGQLDDLEREIGRPKAIECVGLLVGQLLTLPEVMAMHVRAGELVEIANLAHGVLPAAGTLGLPVLATDLRRLVDDIRRGHLAAGEVAARVDKIESLIDRALRFLERRYP